MVKHCFLQKLFYLPLLTISNFPGRPDIPLVECSSRNSYIEPNTQNADADSITSDYTRDKPNSTIDLKVEIHRKNSSESSEEAAQLNKPIVTGIYVYEAELVSEQDHEQHYINRIYGIYIIIHINLFVLARVVRTLVFKDTE